MTAISVVMPVLNEERSVDGAIRSVLTQTFTDLELLVLDGDSTDGTAAIVHQIAEVDPRVRLVRNPQRTIPSALNIALAQAQGRYIARVDGHAAVSETYLERGAATLDADPQVAAVGGKRIGVARTSAGVAVATALSSKFGVGDSINHYATEPQDTDHASFGVFRVSVLRPLGGWDENLLVNEDVDLDHRILAQGHRIRFDPDMCIYWHVRESVPALARQYRRYGRGKAAMVLKNGWGAVRIRHLAPPALVVALALAVVCAVLGWWPLAVLLSLPYALALIAAGVLTLRSDIRIEPPPDTRSGGVRTGDPTAADLGSRGISGPGPSAGRRAGLPRLLGAFMAMHLGWGLGFLEGVLFRLRPATASARVPSRKTPQASSASSVASPHGDAAASVRPSNLQASDPDAADQGGRTPSGR